jgi:hypothetical protein
MMGMTILDRRRDGTPPLRQRDQAHLLVDRRAVLKTAFGAIGAYAATAAGVTWMVGPGRAWAMELERFDESIADTLLHMTRALYPHDKVGDVHYAEVVRALDAEVADGGEDMTKGALYKDGVERLNAAAGGSFKDLDDDAKEKLLEAEAASDDPAFFQAVRGKVVNVLYNSPEVWKIFGYQGPSYEEGGYLFRGFDDLSWLPAPPAEASPPAQDA